MPRAMRIDPDAARFGVILKRLREQKGWTRQKLAQRAGMTPTYIGILEYGGNTPSLPTVLELIEVELVVATRNRSDFAKAGVEIVDPFK
jgi:transcriptional regulator with XRE-family HTH domain